MSDAYLLQYLFIEARFNRWDVGIKPASGEAKHETNSITHSANWIMKKIRELSLGSCKAYQGMVVKMPTGGE
jgi:hypothetical protein